MWEQWVFIELWPKCIIIFKFDHLNISKNAQKMTFYEKRAPRRNIKIHTFSQNIKIRYFLWKNLVHQFWDLMVIFGVVVIVSVLWCYNRFFLVHLSYDAHFFFKIFTSGESPLNDNKSTKICRNLRKSAETCKHCKKSWNFGQHHACL